MLDISQCPSECLPVALVYLQRVLARPKCSITCNNVHRLFGVAMMLASKWLEDQTLCTRDWATVTCLPEKTLVKAEREFLSLLQFNVYCDRDEYLRFVEEGRRVLASPPPSTSGEQTKAPAEVAAEHAAQELAAVSV